MIAKEHTKINGHACRLPIEIYREHQRPEQDRLEALWTHVFRDLTEPILSQYNKDRLVDIRRACLDRKHRESLASSPAKGARKLTDSYSAPTLHSPQAKHPQNVSYASRQEEQHAEPDSLLPEREAHLAAPTVEEHELSRRYLLELYNVPPQPREKKKPEPVREKPVMELCNPESWKDVLNYGEPKKKSLRFLQRPKPNPKDY